ncbi:MAG TPA: tRNA pseudouridine(55) synthase TruB [Dehalococcoidia bacterium]|nr:tRNA pseudouridine(55) synthase TruB [Dehalococcoidia bacterium]
MDGFFNVFKPAGWTSFDVVAALRGPLKQKRLGHGGTLDPAATGVLPIAAGYATRLLEFLVEGDKEYVADIRLGRSTDTYDSEGIETSLGEWRGIHIDNLSDELESFRGTIKQTPPAYSAVKVAGQPAYRRARRGESVELSEREVTIHELELISFEPPSIKLRVVCSKGTYLRSLANDLGEALGCGAYLHGLIRSRVGPFRAGSAIPVDDLRTAALEGTSHRYVLSPDTVVLSMDAAILASRSELEIRQGRTVRLYSGQHRAAERKLPLGRRCRAYTARGSLLGLLGYAGPPALWKPLKVFPEARIGSE